MDYIPVEQARPMRGLRLALGAGAPGPWSISARALFTIRGVPFVPVMQELGGANEALVAWTGRRNSPVAVYEDEPAVDGWLEIAELAERLGSGPSLYPDDPVARALAVGFSAEICGQGGLGWSRRLSMLRPPTPGEEAPAISRQYGLRDDASERAPARIAGILQGLARQLHDQRQRGSDYLLGERLSACDVHWACFSLLFRRLAPEHCPQTAGEKRDIFDLLAPEIRAAADPILFEHRDRVWERHIGLPLTY